MLYARVGDRWEPVGWDEALADIERRLAATRRARSLDGRRRAGLYRSGSGLLRGSFSVSTARRSRRWVRLTTRGQLTTARRGRVRACRRCAAGSWRHARPARRVALPPGEPRASDKASRWTHGVFPPAIRARPAARLSPVAPARRAGGPAPPGPPPCLPGPPRRGPARPRRGPGLPRRELAPPRRGPPGCRAWSTGV